MRPKLADVAGGDGQVYDVIHIAGGVSRPGVSKKIFGHYLPSWNYYQSQDGYRPNLSLLR